MTIALLYSNEVSKYDFGPGHPFRGDRFTSFMNFFEETLGKSGLFEIVANHEPSGDDLLRLWHDNEYIEMMQKASTGEDTPDLWRYLSGDNLSPRTGSLPLGIEYAARVIVRNSVLACQLVEENKYEKAISIGGGLHHAKPRYGEGFCVYNDVVISARHLIEKQNLKRILVLDTDAHAGNGTCEAFYSDPRVLFIDLHQKYIYPGTGFEDEIGEGKGKGFTINLPLPPFAGDEAYRTSFEEIIIPVVEEFNPQFVIRNGGSDPHPSDTITQLGLTMKGFKYIGRTVRQLAEICKNKESDLICSGYKPEVLSRVWTALLSGLANYDVDLEESIPLHVQENQSIKQVKSTIEQVKTNLQPYWKSFKT